jgi:predicted ATPase
MLSKWGITNFKSIYNADLDLAPLTVLTGTNSSGKSSFIQSMLLVAQTMQNQFAGRELVLNGNLLELGRFDEILSYGAGDSKNTIDIRWDLKLENGTFHSGESNKKLVLNSVHCETEFKLNDSSKLPDSGDMNPAKTVGTESVKGWSRLSKITQEMNFVDEFNDNINCKFSAGEMAPEEGFDLEKEKKLRSEKSQERILPIIYMSDNLKNKLSDINIPQWAALNHFMPKEILGQEVDEITETSQKLTDYFVRSFKYLGPLRFREALSPFLKASDPKDVGIKGEYTAAVYDTFYDEDIEYLPSEYFDKDEVINYIPVERTFSDALNDWLHYLGVAESINVVFDKFGYNMGFIPSDTDKLNVPRDRPLCHNIIHVGTGVSQVLPILVMGLLAEPDSTLIFEQPELHLHPKVQSRLADFFLSMALLGRQCIIETHSEYLIYALRYRISESLLKNDESVQNATKLYFADKKDGKSKFQEIKVNRHGEISAWPDGFFDERQKLSDRMLESILSDMEGKDD